MPLCDDCSKLIGAPGATEPHFRLVGYTEYSFKAHGQTLSEKQRPYLCQNCKTTWDRFQSGWQVHQEGK